MEYKKLAGLVGTFVTLGVFCVMLWLLIPSSKVDDKVEVGGDADIQTIGTAYTLIDLHSVFALWSGSTMLIVFVVFLVTGCCCKNKALKKIHGHMREKLKSEFVMLGNEFAVHCRPADTSNAHDGVQEGARVGYQAASSVLGVQAAVTRQGLQDKKARRDRVQQEMDDLEDEEARIDIANRRALLDAKRRQPVGDVYGQQGPVYYGCRDAVVYGQQAEGGAAGAGAGGSFQRSQYYRNETYDGDYQGVRATVDHRAMVHAPGGRVRGRGVTSNRFGVEVQDLSLVGQQIYSSLNGQ